MLLMLVSYLFLQLRDNFLEHNNPILADILQSVKTRAR